MIDNCGTVHWFQLSIHWVIGSDNILRLYRLQKLKTIVHTCTTLMLTQDMQQTNINYIIMK